MIWDYAIYSTWLLPCHKAYDNLYYEISHQSAGGFACCELKIVYQRRFQSACNIKHRWQTSVDHAKTMNHEKQAQLAPYYVGGACSALLIAAWVRDLRFQSTLFLSKLSLRVKSESIQYQISVTNLRWSRKNHESLERRSTRALLYWLSLQHIAHCCPGQGPQIPIDIISIKTILKSEIRGYKILNFGALLSQRSLLLG